MLLFFKWYIQKMREITSKFDQRVLNMIINKTYMVISFWNYLFLFSVLTQLNYFQSQFITTNTNKIRCASTSAKLSDQNPRPRPNTSARRRGDISFGSRLKTTEDLRMVPSATMSGVRHQSQSQGNALAQNRRNSLPCTVKTSQTKILQ